MNPAKITQKGSKITKKPPKSVKKGRKGGKSLEDREKAVISADNPQIRSFGVLKAFDRLRDTQWAEIVMGVPDYDPFDQRGDCYFNPVAAREAIAFIEECIKHAKGTESTPAGSPFLLQPWEKAIVTNLFGWKRLAGTRRYRECLIYVGKKNGKTSLSAAILLLVMMTDGEVGGELYSAAASRDQAAIIFQHVMGMVKAEPALSERLRVYGAKGGGQVKRVVYEDQSTFYSCLSADADTNDGANPTLLIIDELHRHRDGELAEVLVKSTGARAQPLTIYTTTADYNRPSYCNVMLKRAKQVRDNKGDQSRMGYAPEFLPVIYETIKPKDNVDPQWFRNPEVWKAANPNLGVTVTYEFMETQARNAAEVPSELNNFLRLHLNIVTDAAETWIQMDKWNACSGLLDGESPREWRARKLSELHGRECFLGLDLSSKIDCTCLVQIFRPPEPEEGEEQEPWVIIPYFWVPNETATQKEAQDQVKYSVWHRHGFVTLTEGNEIDFQTIRAKINSLAKDFQVIGIGYDNWNATELSRQLREEDGLEEQMHTVRQGSITLSYPMKEFEAQVLGHRVEHGANPCMDWMIANVVVKKDENGNIQPNKKKSINRIDGPVATFTGYAVALNASAEQSSLSAEWV